MTPVLSPDLLKTVPTVKKPADLRHLTLLHERDRDNWTSWFQQAGHAGLVAKRGPLYADIALAMQAALRGHGVALVDTILAADEIAAGRLVQPFPQGLKLGAYWLVAPDLAALNPPARAFADWLTAAIRRPRAPNKAMRKSKRPSAAGGRAMKTGARRQSTA
jgi:LysR family glycine cleavage system transcriptional activator